MLRAAFLHRADHRIDQHNDEDHHRITRMAHREGDDRGDKENVDQRTGELRRKHLPHRLVRGFGQLVETALGQSCRRIRLRQTGLRVRAQGFHGLFSRTAVPGDC